MPELDLSQNLFDVGAEAQLGDWADAAIAASLDLRAQAELKRGINLELGVGVMAQLEAHFHKFLAADAEVRAEAAAGLKGQVQAPIDLFGEAGVAVRLEAAARAEVSARLGIGLSIGDFIALAEQDPRMRGIWLKLFRIFLEELSIGAGIRASAAYSAMAFVKLGITGRLIEDPVTQTPPGFNIGAQVGVGLKGGTSWKLFAHLGFADTRRLIRRVVDVSVDEALGEIEGYLPDPTAKLLLSEVRTPVKIALRTAFELGLALAESGPTLANTAPQLSLHCLQVGFEEMQRYLLERLTDMATQLFRRALAGVGFDLAVWDQSEPHRKAFADHLRALPAEPFEPTADNAVYWGGLIDRGITVAVQLGAGNSVDEPWVEPLAVVWASAQLLFATVERVTSASARASFLGAVSANATTPSFQGPLSVGSQPADVVKSFIIDRLGIPDQTLTQDHLVEFLVSDTLLDGLVRMFPEVKPVLELIAGPDNGALVAAAQTILRNAGAFAPDPNSGLPDAESSLRALSLGLRRYLDVRIQNEIAPMVREALGDNPDLQVYLDEVLLESTDFVIGTVFDKVLDWGFGGIGYREGIREACSSILMKLLGRSVVVTTDVIMAHAMEHVHDELVELADDADEPDGLGAQLADTIGQDREFVTEVLEETLRIAADVFQPFSPERRERIRRALYGLLDPMPSGQGANWLDDLAQDAFIPDAQTREALMQLGSELGAELMEVVADFFWRVLAKIADKIAAEFAELVDDFVEAAEEWVGQLAGLINALAARLLALPGEIAALANAANEQMDAALESLQDTVGALTSSSVREDVRTAAVDFVVDAAMGPLGDSPDYFGLGGNVRTQIRNTLRTTADALVGDVILSPLMAAFAANSDQIVDLLDTVRDLLAELRTVDPDANITEQVTEILLDWAEERLIDAVGGGAISFRIAFDHTFTVKPPKIPSGGYFNNQGEWVTTYYQPPSPSQTVAFDLGTVKIEFSGLRDIVRAAISGLGVLENLARQVGQQLAAAFATQDARDAAVVEQGLVEGQHESAQSQLTDVALSNAGIVVLEPSPSALYEHDLDIELFLENVPRSFLGLGELEQQRVHVYLNGDPLDLAAFTVTAQKGAPAMSSERLTTVLHEPGALIGLWGQEVQGQKARARSAELNLAQGMKARVLPETAPRMVAAAKDEGSCCERTRVVVAKARAIHRQPGVHPPVAKRAVRGSSPARGGAGFVEPRPVASRSQDLQWVGKKLTRPERALLREAHGPGLVLAHRVKLASLREGFNTLSVAVVDGDEQRLERTVVFVSAPPAEPEKGQVRLPVQPDLGVTALPPVMLRLFGIAERERETEEPASKGRDSSGPRRNGPPLWIGHPTDRAKTRSERRAQERQRLRKNVDVVRVVAEEVAGGGLRPGGRPTRPPVLRRPDDEGGHSESCTGKEAQS